MISLMKHLSGNQTDLLFLVATIAANAAVIALAKNSSERQTWPERCRLSPLLQFELFIEER